MREDTQTLTFAAIVCVSCSLLLSGTAAILKGRQDANVALDMQKNIVKAFGVDTKTAKAADIQSIFDQHIAETSAGDGLPLYAWKENGIPTKYAFPISGKGLWSMLYGYLSIDSDLKTIAGISFYKHGETPGLGAEIEKDWFQQQFKGKQLFEKGTPTDFTVAKAGTKAPEDKVAFTVDGISGATLTSKGVQKLINAEAARYSEYFKSIQGQ